jgi:NitT/TauT family transport system substrate-binding protein
MGPESEAPEPEPVAMTVAFTSIGLSSVPLLAAIDDLRDQGYEIETPELAESELVTEGVAQGEFQFGSGANNSSLAAIAQEADVRWIVDRTLNEWQVYSREGIDGCEAVVGSRVAIHSPGSVSGAMLRDWVNNNCPEDVADSYEPLIIEGSQNRLAALLADQIDTSPVEFGDALILENEGGFARVVSFAADLPGLHPTSVYGNGAWMSENPEATTALIVALLEQHRRINSEDGYLMELFSEYLPEEAAGENAEAIATAYVDAGIFPDDGGLDAEAVEYTIGFFGPDGTGDVEAELTPDQVADLSYLEAALDELGG